MLRLRLRPHGQPVLAVALAVALTVLAVGCTAELKPAAKVTASSARLNADVRCIPGARSRIWWQLRAAGAARWKVAGPKRRFACGTRKTARVSRTVKGLRGGVRYRFRLVADPAPAGGIVFRTPALWFTTKGAGAPAPTPPAKLGFTAGVVASADHARSAAAAAVLGADVARVEFDVGTPASAMRQAIGGFAAKGTQVLLLAGFHGRMPTEAEAQNLAGWAAEFGPGGSFWAGRPDGHLAVSQIEFGNETSYGHQYGDSWSAPSYTERARLYATRFAQAHAAIGVTDRPVGLLAQADDGGSGSANWVNGMFAAVPNLASMVDGWTVHPYGPRSRWEPKLRRLIAQTAAHGAPATISIDVTEYGVSSSDGLPLGDNYGWPLDQTYGEAAASLDATVAAMRSDPQIGPRLRLFMIYAAHDLRPSGSSRDREHSFGALEHDLGAKGAYTVEVKEQLR